MTEQKQTLVPLTVAAQAAAGVLLIVVGGVTWRAAGVADAAADVHEHMATLQSSTVTTVSIPGWLTPVATLLDSDVPAHDLVADYWTGDYRSLADPDRSVTAHQAEVLLMSANAALRRAHRDAAGRPLTSERLDQVLQAYAAVLKNSGFDRDAAYNYEYVARLRDAAARAKPRPAPPARTAVRNPRSGEFPDGPTIHGRPGTHPPATKGEEFEVLTPMNFGDREAQPEPTPGVRLPKKG